MRITSRRKTIAFFVVLGSCLVGLAIALNVGWIIINWREGVKLIIGVIVVAAIILGIILNTGFLVREVRLNEQHDSFINGVTHELKTPIASIRLYLETLQRREVDEAQRQQFYKLMLLDTDRLLGTVEQVLKAGEAGHRQRIPLRTQVELHALVRECLELSRTRHHLKPENLYFEPEQTAGEFPVEGDPEELRTAVTNVVENAIKYSGEKVDVAVRLDAPDQNLVVLRVRDRGVGVPPADLKRIFRRFYRVRHRSLSHIKGTGLGLFIVRAVARAHGGKAYAESEGEGRGTTIVIELPRSAA
ncbi:MAG: sensor histidine kinase [Candidatus Acidiferrales bacterium]